LRVDPAGSHTVYAASGFLYKSSDGGRSWSRLQIGMADMPDIVVLAFDAHTPATLYVGTIQRHTFADEHRYPNALPARPQGELRRPSLQ
jgi:hypothetical protein